MARPGARRHASTIAAPVVSRTPDLTIILGDTEPTEPSINQPIPLDSPYSEGPLFDDDHLPQPFQPPTEILAELQEIDETPDKEDALVWSEEMKEALIDVLEEVFTQGGGADNSFKTATFETAATRVRRVYRGTSSITSNKCKNKWADLKAKWAHWKELSGMSGFGWNEEKELFEAYDYVWDALNKAYPRIIWHKTNVLPYRDQLSVILHNVKATGGGALSLATPTPVDPRLEGIQSLSTPSRASSASPNPSKSSYKKSKKRVLAEIMDEGESFGSLSSNKKVDLGAALLGLTREIERARKAKENQETSQQQALKLLCKAYTKRLANRDFVRAISLFKDKGNAVTFLTLEEGEYRDLWLEEEIGCSIIGVGLQASSLH
jgi:hypothetical protein